MLNVLVIWLTFAFFSFGTLGLNYIYTKEVAKGPWKIKTNKEYLPKISIIVPTYNEHAVIGYKLKNLVKLEYPKNLIQIVFVDSQSTDSTVDVIGGFAENYPNINIKVLMESERKGKSSALNAALKSCIGDVVVVSDADCFWPTNILSKALSYLADPMVGAISGSKKLLNPEDSWITKSEAEYLKSMNLMKLGESKKWSTLFFEGGFSAYKKDVLDRFDPYNTGSDDCGTVIRVLEKNFRAIMLPEAEFFTTFPRTWKGRVEIKIRRASQLTQILRRYAVLLFRKKIKNAKGIVAKNVLVYLLAPIIFPFFVTATFYLMLKLTSTILFLLVFLIPKVRDYFIEAALNYMILLYSIILTVSKKKFSVWKKPEDRPLVKEDILLHKGLI